MANFYARLTSGGAAKRADTDQYNDPAAVGGEFTEKR